MFKAFNHKSDDGDNDDDNDDNDDDDQMQLFIKDLFSELNSDGSVMTPKDKTNVHMTMKIDYGIILKTK